jgi:hypothetical protein
MKTANDPNKLGALSLDFETVEASNPNRHSVPLEAAQ